MTVGDAVSLTKNVTIYDNRFHIRPPVGEEWVIHNIKYDNAGFRMDFYVTKMENGSGALKFHEVTQPGILDNLGIHVTNDQWIMLLNTSAGTTMKASFDGIRTK